MIFRNTYKNWDVYFYSVSSYLYPHTTFVIRHLSRIEYTSHVLSLASGTSRKEPIKNFKWPFNQLTPTQVYKRHYPTYNYETAGTTTPSGETLQ